MFKVCLGERRLVSNACSTVMQYKCGSIVDSKLMNCRIQQ